MTKVFQLKSCWLNICVLLTVISLINIAECISANNVCTFRTQGKLFSLAYLQTPTPYRVENDEQIIYFNFCNAFIPPQCPASTPSAFSFVITKMDEDNTANNGYKCMRYSSNSTISLFYTKYDQTYNQDEQEEDRDKKTLKLFMINQDLQLNNTELRLTMFKIDCSGQYAYQVQSAQVEDGKLTIQGNSIYGCPVLQLSAIWKVFTENKVVFGLFLFIIGFYLLFYGRSAIDITVFIAVFFISIALLGSFMTIFVNPNSTNTLIYGSFLLLLFVSCLIGYAATKLINVSVFFIGAFFGMIVGVLVSSTFSKIFDIYSSWTLVVFILLFAIPLGLLTFKFHDQVIIASTSFTGAYMVIRPFSWIFGGFPNQFLLYKTVESGQLEQLPWTFYIYVILIISLASVGSMYQKLKLSRQNPHQQIQINIIQQGIQQPIDAIKNQVDKIIEKFRHQNPSADSPYHNLENTNLKNQNKKQNI